MGLDCPGSNWSNNNATPTYLYLVPEKSHLLDCSEFTGSVSEKITAGSWSCNKNQAKIYVIIDKYKEI